MKKKAKNNTAAAKLDAVLKVRLSSGEKAAIRLLADRARTTASALARRRLMGAKVTFRPSLAALEHLHRACVLAQALAAKSADARDGEIAAILAAQRAAMDALGVAMDALGGSERSD